MPPEGSHGEGQQQEAMHELLEKLNEAFVGLHRSGKGALQIEQRAGSQTSGKGSHYMQTLGLLRAAMEKADGVKDDLGFLIKFRKTRQQQPLSVELAKEVLGMAAQTLTELLDSYKTMKALIPASSKSAA